MNLKNKNCLIYDTGDSVSLNLGQQYNKKFGWLFKLICILPVLLFIKRGT
jgi:hypothetical protein